MSNALFENMFTILMLMLNYQSILELKHFLGKRKMPNKYCVIVYMIVDIPSVKFQK